MPAPTLSRLTDPSGLTIGGGNTAVTRKGIWQFEQTTTSSALGAAGLITLRRRARIPQKTTRWRLHVRNFSYLLWANPAGSLTNFKLAYGFGAPVTSQYTSFTTTAALTQLTSGGSAVNATMTGGNEVITDWITGDAGTYRDLIICAQFNVGASDAISFGGGEQCYSVGVSGDLTNAAMASPTRVSSQAFLNMYIEYEFADNAVPIILNLGNSLSGGGNGASPNYENRGELDSWGGQWAATNRGVCASLAVAGAWAANFGTSDPRWGYYNTLDSTVPFSPDAVTLVAFDSSDLIGSNSPAVWSSGLLTNATMYSTQAIQKIQSLYPDALIIATNNPPRIASIGDGYSTGTNSVERDRITHNQWWESCPLGIHACVDINRIPTDWANPARLRKDYDPGDGTHARPIYSAEMAAAIGAAIHMMKKAP